MKPTDKLYRQIVTRSFAETGIDGGPGLVAYIDRLEVLALTLDKKLRDAENPFVPRHRRRARIDIWKVLDEHR